MAKRRFRSLIPGANKAPEASRDSQMKSLKEKLRQVIVGMTQSGSQSSEDNDVRRLVVGAAKLARSPGKLRAAMEGMAAAEQVQVEEASTWLTHTQIEEGESGRFDSCDLRNWLAIAEKAGVAAIPAKEIASFTAEEYAALVGVYGLNREAPRIKRMFDAIEKSVASEFTAEEREAASEAVNDSKKALNVEDASERLFTAMDSIPEGWMIRSSICGGDNLKALAGTGVTETFIPEVKFGPDLEIGPGWVRSGNRRRIDIQDKRTMQLYVRNDTVPLAFLARPWTVASRWMEGRDPHRAGTPLDIPGTWPAEWRAFVRAGKVVGVSAYYAWAGQIDAVSAQNALAVRDLAQKMIDTAIAQGLTARSMDDALMRAQSPRHARALEAMGFSDGDFDATIDFIETEDGPIMLEAGPGCGPFGSGHPCGFAGDYQTLDLDLEDGHGVQTLKWMPCEGVAFRTMDHILMGEPGTWATGNKDNAILSWDDAARIASN